MKTRYKLVEDVLTDPVQFIRRLSVVDRHQHLRPMQSLEEAQLQLIRSFIANPRTIVLKARQQGITTASLAALLYWTGYHSPYADSTISVTHEGSAIGAVNQKLKAYIKGLPPFIRPDIIRDTSNVIELATPRLVREVLGWTRDMPGTAKFVQVMAGGKGQGRSFTFGHSHWTEVAFYGTGSSAIDKQSNSEGADQVAWQSIRSTMHDSPLRRDVVESTANGPSGLFYKLVRSAQAGQDESGWSFLFFPWFLDGLYVLPVPKGFVLNQDEERMLRLYGDAGLTMGHLVWRRHKLVVDNYSLARFAKEYPSNPEEPFMVSGRSWFDSDRLNEMLAFASPVVCPPTQAEVILERPQPGRTYYGGVDTSGGVGLDFFAVYIVDDTGRLVYRFRSNTLKPERQADRVARASEMYGRARMLIELNKYGKRVDELCVERGVNLWRDENGKGWWTQMGSTASKYRLCDAVNTEIAAGRYLPDIGERPMLPEPLVISQLLSMVQQANGNISARNDPDAESSDAHDDDAMAWLFAQYNARERFYRRTAPSRDSNILDELARTAGLVPAHREFTPGRG